MSARVDAPADRTADVPPEAEQPGADQPRAERSLAPLRDALLRAARRDADEAVAEATRGAEHAMAAARSEAGSGLAQARSAGEQDAERIRRDQRARARRRARGVVLSAQNDVLEALRRAVHERLRLAWNDPAARPVLRARLTEQALADLGPTARVHEHPDGIVATLDHARVPYLLPDLADDVIAARSTELAAAWTP